MGKLSDWFKSYGKTVWGTSFGDFLQSALDPTYPIRKAANDLKYEENIANVASQISETLGMDYATAEAIARENVRQDDLGAFYKKKVTESDAASLIDQLNSMAEAANDTLITEAPDYQSIYNDVVASRDKELEEMTGRYKDEIDSLNKSYNDYANSVLSLDYQKNAQLMDVATSEMKKSRANAMEAGASAGLRIANNINTLLSVQNQQAQQSLETSNNLAQMLINQRNAASNLRSEYYDKKENWNRQTESDALTRMNTVQTIYDNDTYNAENKFSSQYGDNPFSSYAQGQLRYRDSKNNPYVTKDNTYKSTAYKSTGRR